MSRTKNPTILECVAASPEKCIACDKLLPLTNRGRKAVRCPGDRECERTYQILYGIGRRMLRAKEKAAKGDS